MNKDFEEFKKDTKEILDSIYSKLNNEEEEFLSSVIETFNEVCERNTKAIDKLYCWGEALDPTFQKEMLGILKGEEDE